MKNTLKNFLLAASLVLVFAGLSFGQTALTQTTLGAAQNIGVSGLASGNTSTISLTVNLASATGITQSFNGQPVTYILVGQEVEGILTVLTGQTTIFNVLRGQMGTKMSPHASGDMVLAEVVTPQFGGFSGSGGFQQTDAPINGACTATATLVTPWVNVNTGAQWLCSTITNTWVPGWNNPFSSGRQSATAAVASAGTMTPSGPFFHVTGTTTITTFGIPIGFNATALGGGQFCYVNDGVASTTAGNNVGASITALANTQVCWTWDAQNSKFYPFQ
jgi:hypothetical protein